MMEWMVAWDMCWCLVRTIWDWSPKQDHQTKVIQALSMVSHPQLTPSFFLHTSCSMSLSCPIQAHFQTILHLSSGFCTVFIPLLAMVLPLFLCVCFVLLAPLSGWLCVRLRIFLNFSMSIKLPHHHLTSSDNGVKDSVECLPLSIWVPSHCSLSCMLSFIPCSSLSLFYSHSCCLPGMFLIWCFHASPPWPCSMLIIHLAYLFHLPWSLFAVTVPPQGPLIQQTCYFSFLSFYLILLFWTLNCDGTPWVFTYIMPFTFHNMYLPWGKP